MSDREEYRKKMDDNAFLDFGPEPVDKELYDELVTKELDEAREGAGKRKYSQRDEDDREFSQYTPSDEDKVTHGKKTAANKKVKGIRRVVKRILHVVVVVAIVYFCMYSFLCNYYGDNSTINYIKYSGYTKNEQSNSRVGSFDSIEIDVYNCDVTIEDSYDNEFHVYYRLFTKDGELAQCEIEQRGDSKVLVIKADSKKDNGAAWDIFDTAAGYDMSQYVKITVPKGMYGTFKVHATDGFAIVSDVEGEIQNIELESENILEDFRSIRIENVCVDKLTVTGVGKSVHVEESRIKEALIKVNGDYVSMDTSTIEEALELKCENSFIMLDGLDIKEGARVKAETTNDYITVTLAGDLQDYHIIADAGESYVYFDELDYNDEGRFETGEGSKQIELYDSNKSIHIDLEADN